MIETKLNPITLEVRWVIQRLISIAAFRHDKVSASTAIKRSIQTLIESGIIAELGRTEMQKKYETGQKAYMIVDVRIIRSKS